MFIIIISVRASENVVYRSVVCSRGVSVLLLMSQVLDGCMEVSILVKSTSLLQGNSSIDCTGNSI